MAFALQNLSAGSIECCSEAVTPTVMAGTLMMMSLHLVSWPPPLLQLLAVAA
jgi:hypothetical protein